MRRLNLPTLVYRRARGDMIEMYKILSGKYDHDVCDFVQLSSRTSRGHRYKISKEYVRLDTRKFSFVHRSVDMWNSLPEIVVEAPSVKAFESRLDKLWADKPWKFDFEGFPNTCTRQGTNVNIADLIEEA